MVNWRRVLVDVRNLWNTFLRWIQPYLDYDSDRCLDLIRIGAGIRQLPGAERWKRFGWILYRILGFYQLLIASVRVGFSIRNGNDTLVTCSSIAFFLAQMAIYAKIWILGHYGEAVQQSKTFVNSNYSCSGDPDYDATVRRHHAEVPGKVTLAIFVIVCLDQVILSIPNPARNLIFGMPEQFVLLGTTVARLLQEAYVQLLCIFYGCGHFIGPLTIIPLLQGLKQELMIVARGYEVVATLNNVPEPSQRLAGNVSMLKHLKHKMGIIVDHHVEVLRIIHLVQPLVNYIYAIIYYSVMIVVSLHVFIVTKSELTLISLVVLGFSGLLVVECYFWSRMVDSIQETMELIADRVAHVGFGLQHTVDNHREYIGLRTSILIIQLDASQCDCFSCGEVFPISVESFGYLCSIIYKFATFLLNFD